jgi:integrase
MQEQSTAPQPRDSRKLTKTREAGIYRRDNHYVVRFRAHGRERKKVARTLAEARAVKAAVKADLDRGEYRETSKVSFEDYARDWLKTYTGRTSRGLRESTKAEYKRAIEQRAIPFFGRMRLAAVTTPDVKRYIASVAGSGVSVSTVRGAYAPVRALFATAVEDGLIRVNPAAGIRLAVSNGNEEEEIEIVKALTEEELRKLIAATAEEHRLLVRFLAHTGLRIGEALALRWEDVDLGKRRVKVRRRFYKGSFAPPKSRYGRRDVPLSPGMAQDLWNTRKRAGESELVFPGRNSEPLAASTALRAVKAAGKTAGAPWAGLHTLRHTCATMLFRNGANAKQVQLWLGHHSPAFTLATYVHLLPDDLPDASFLDATAAAVVVSQSESDSEPQAPRTKVRQC